MTISDYITNINKRYTLGNYTEHTFRGDLQQLIESTIPGISATNEPKRQQCGAPDYILTRRDIPVGFIEAKNIGDDDLRGIKKNGNKSQFDRYKGSLENIIFTDYLDFYIYRSGELIHSISIATVDNGKVMPLSENYSRFEDLLKDFTSNYGQSITSSKKLAEMMAGKARLLAEIIESSLNKDDADNDDSTLKEQMNAFKDILIHDINPKGFSDVYAQTIVYGMFAARLHDSDLDTFSREEAAKLIPKSNPFLRKLFGYIAGPDLDDRIKWIVDDLTTIFLACDIKKILSGYGKATKMEDPIIHFYETFLSEYDPSLRKSRGVWYTPQPVVNFIVRAVDDVLKSDFGLSAGLADSSKTTIKLNSQTPDKRSSTGYKQIDQVFHKVQILDPATGTGTFLAEVIKHIHGQFKGQEGIWSSYVDNHLLSRLNGFELLMASYAMAHLKLDLLLSETGYVSNSNKRLRVYLTNSLEESHPDTGSLWANWLSSEANEANHIKRDSPVMVCLGNPPYSISSSNKSEWIENLTKDYKKDLIEKSFNSLSDDYVKFIRFGQHFISKNGEGIMAYISNNSFLDGLIHRQMRKSLLTTFDNIYILDLHGDAKKKEICLDGTADRNVFDIMQGVSINIFIKNTTPNKTTLGDVFHYDLQGKREFKYDFLQENSIKSIKWKKLDYRDPGYFFTNKDFTGEAEYNNGFKVDELFSFYNNGIETGKDPLFYSVSKSDLIKKIVYAFDNKEEAINKYQMKDTKSFLFRTKFLNSKVILDKIRKVSYRPFDVSYCYYDEYLLRRPAFKAMTNMFYANHSLLCPRQFSGVFKHVFISNLPTDGNLTGTAKKFGSAPIFPLYIYPDEGLLNLHDNSSKRIPNLNTEIIDSISEKLNLIFCNEKEQNKDTFSPIDVLDYIYAVLHCKSYREKYNEFLKIDFPRVPYPSSVDIFWQLVEAGKSIRSLHLLESPTLNKFITQYPIGGDNLVSVINYEDNKVYINDTQYFDNVPSIAWEFYIGGYQPAQKWLKDRKNSILDYSDIQHYQKIIVALAETNRLMQEIEKIDFMS